MCIYIYIHHCIYCGVYFNICVGQKYISIAFQTSNAPRPGWIQQVTDRRSDRSPIARIGCLTMWDFIPSWTCAPCCWLDTTEPPIASITWAVVSKVFLFSPRKLGEDSQFWRAYFSKGLKPPTSYPPWNSPFASSHLLKWDFWKGILDPELRRIQVKDF